MAVNKLLPFANGNSANVVDFATWSALTQILGQGFVTGVARSDYANRLFSQGALASYVLGQFVVEQTAQDADLNESVFYTNFKNALINYIKANAVSLDTAQTVGGVKTFTSSPLVLTADAGDNTQKVANTAFVKTAIDNSVASVKAVSYGVVQTLTDAEKVQARANIGAPSPTDISNAVNAVAPIGSYIYFAGSSVPDHYLLCNGAAVSRTDYADLYAVIGDTYGSGDGSTTFNLPNLVDKFLEGSGTSGTEKAAGLPNIDGAFVVRGLITSGTARQIVNSSTALYSLSGTDFGMINADVVGESTGSRSVNLDASRVNSIYGNSNTVQPPALTALPCIRYE